MPAKVRKILCSDVEDLVFSEVLTMNDKCGSICIGPCKLYPSIFGTKSNSSQLPAPNCSNSMAGYSAQ